MKQRSTTMFGSVLILLIDCEHGCVRLLLEIYIFFHTKELNEKLRKEPEFYEVSKLIYFF